MPPGPRSDFRNRSPIATEQKGKKEPESQLLTCPGWSTSGLGCDRIFLFLVSGTVILGRPMTAKAKLISVQIQRHLIGPAEITWLIAGLSLDVCAQPLKWPRSLEGLLKCRFAALISLEGPGICVFNRHPWRLMEVGHRAQVERW